MNLDLPEIYSAIRTSLANYTKIDEVKKLRDKAVAMEVYAFQAKDEKIIADAIALKEYATRQIGKIMEGDRAADKLATGTRGQLAGKTSDTGKGRGKAKAVVSGGADQSPPEIASLADRGVDKSLAKAARKAAATPEDRFEAQTRKKMSRGVRAVTDSKETRRRQATSGKHDWYTPRLYLDAAIEVMGAIDLDPASSSHAQKHVKAANYFTEEQNGLNQTWFGHVFLNPPYAAVPVRAFTDKLLESWSNNDIKSGILLTNNATDTEWWGRALETASAVCFTTGRIHFLELDGNKLTEKTSPTCGQTFFYFGRAPKRFTEIFARFGRTIYGWNLLGGGKQ